MSAEHILSATPAGDNYSYRPHPALKWVLILLVYISYHAPGYSQSYVTLIIDAKHLAIVNENGAVRLASEIKHNDMLRSIQKNTQDINLNLSVMQMTKRMVLESMNQVNELQKTGWSVQHVSRLLTEIIQQSAGMLDEAKSEPWLLLFAEGTARQLKERGVNLASEVSAFVLKEGANVLIDYAKRDGLLRKIILDLKVIRALLYSMRRSMYYAKINGVLLSANPFKDFINKDKRLVDEILRGYKTLKP